MTSRTSAAALQRCFDILEAAVIAGERCPVNAENGGPAGVCSHKMGLLARKGMIRIEISTHNYRTVTLLVGVHAGKQTKGPAPGGRVWKVIDRHTRINGRFRESSSAMQGR